MRDSRAWSCGSPRMYHSAIACSTRPRTFWDWEAQCHAAWRTGTEFGWLLRNIGIIVDSNSFFRFAQRPCTGNNKSTAISPDYDYNNVFYKASHNLYYIWALRPLITSKRPWNFARRSTSNMARAWARLDVARGHPFEKISLFPKLCSHTSQATAELCIAISCDVIIMATHHGRIFSWQDAQNDVI